MVSKLGSAAPNEDSEAQISSKEGKDSHDRCVVPRHDSDEPDNLDLDDLDADTEVTLVADEVLPDNIVNEVSHEISRNSPSDRVIIKPGEALKVDAGTLRMGDRLYLYTVDGDFLGQLFQNPARKPKFRTFTFLSPCGRSMLLPYPSKSGEMSQTTFGTQLFRSFSADLDILDRIAPDHFEIAISYEGNLYVSSFESDAGLSAKKAQPPQITLFSEDLVRQQGSLAEQPKGLKLAEHEVLTLHDGESALYHIIPLKEDEFLIYNAADHMVTHMHMGHVPMTIDILIDQFDLFFEEALPNGSICLKSPDSTYKLEIHDKRGDDQETMLSLRKKHSAFAFDVRFMGGKTKLRLRRHYGGQRFVVTYDENEGLRLEGDYALSYAVHTTPALFEQQEEDGNAFFHGEINGGNPLVGMSSAAVGRSNYAWNEDTIRVNPISGRFGVVDGMGGMGNGGIAANLGADAIVVSPAQLQAAIWFAHKKLELLNSQMGQRVSDAVFSVLEAEGDIMSMAHRGDSMVYRIRDGKVERLTKIHTYRNGLIEQGIFTEEQIERGMLPADYKERLQHVVASLGNVGRPGALATQQRRFPMEKGDRWLVVSDGVNLTEEEIVEAVWDQEPHDALRRLFATQRMRNNTSIGAEDNTTALLYVHENMAVADTLRPGEME